MNQRDLELLSSYLDGQLNPSDSARLETRLKTDVQLASILNDLRATRTLLRKLPARRAPRNFTLTRKMVGQNPPLPKAYPFFRFATALATLLFVFSFGLNSISQMTAPVFGMGGGGSDASQQNTELFAAEAPAATEAPATEAPAEPSVGLAPAPTMTASVEDALRTAETPTLKAVDVGNAAAGQEFQVQKRAPLVSSTWQIVLAVVAGLSALFMVLMRRIATSHWR
jgi:anti-sigma factor RsiW